MKRRVLLSALSVAVLAGAAGLLWLRSAGAPPMPLAASAPERSTEPVERASVELVEPSESRQLEEPRVAVGGRDLAASSPRARAESADELELRFVGPDGAAVGVVDVLVVADAKAANGRRLNDPDTVDELTAAHGRPFRADGDGSLRIPLPVEGSTLVSARAGRLWGFEVLPPSVSPDEAREIELAVDHRLRVRVVDAAGAALAGAVVEIVRRTPWGTWPARQATTQGPESLASFPHVQFTLEPTGKFTWGVRPRALFEESLAVELHRERLPTDVVQLHVPSTGSVDLRVFDEHGELFDGEATVALRIVREGEARAHSPFDHRERPQLEHEVVAGTARFERVELGRELEADVRRGESRISTRAYANGPTRTGETRSIDVRLGADHPVVRLHAVDSSGRPFGGESLDTVVETDSEHMANRIETSVATDDEGVFYVDLAHDWTEGRRRTLTVVRESADGEELSGSVDLARELDAGVHDLGAVRLEPPPVLVSGRVVADGTESGANVRLVLQSYQEGRAAWSTVRDFKERTDAHGEFEIRRRHRGARLRIAAKRAGSVGAAREFAPGEAGLVLELTPEGAIEGVVLLDDEVPGSLVELSVEGDVEHLNYVERTTQIGEDGAFRIGRLRAGEHSISVRIRRHHDAIGVFEGIPVTAARTTRDARLNPLDLRGRFRVHEVRLSADEHRLSGQVSFGPSGSDPQEAKRAWFDGSEFDLVTEHELLDVEIVARGYRTARLAGVRGRIEVELRRSQSVRLALAPDVELPDRPHFLKAALTRDGHTHNAIDWAAPAFDDETREISVRVPELGKMQVVWIVETRGPSTSSARVVSVDDPQFVDVLDGQNQVFEITLTPEQYAQVAKHF